jgi:hypothetical protein
MRERQPGEPLLEQLDGLVEGELEDEAPFLL